jgi:histidinol-phosphate aminotransferase
VLVLDGSISPYLPTREILDAAEAAPVFEPRDLARMLRERLALLHSVTPDRIALFPNDESRLDRLMALRPGAPLAVYPPSEQCVEPIFRRCELIEVDRGERFQIESRQIELTPAGATALVMTPNDPTGNAVSVTVAAHLARQTGLLLLDERSAGKQRRSMIPLVQEFDSIVLLRSFDDWAGLGADAPGFAITAARIAGAIDRSDELDAGGLQRALAAVSNASMLDAIANRVRIERLRLYRMLRKLNLLAPFPSDAGYVLATVTRGDRDVVRQALAEREIAVYSPRQPRLADTLRFSAISPAATRRLQSALVEISRLDLD